MDMKFKIIIVIFVAIAFMYIGHFMITYMGGKTKQETVAEEFNDVEHYEEPSPEEPKKTNQSSPVKYDQRILVLDDIEKLEIKDKEVKGKLMELLFNEDNLKQVSDMSSSERSTYIKKKLNDLTSPEPAVKNVQHTIQESKSPFLDTSDLVTKTQETINSLQSVQSGLKEIHRIAESFKSHTKKPQHEITSFKEPYIPSTTLIEGFENMRSYASLF